MKFLTKPGNSRDIIFIFLIVLGALLYRRPDAFTHPQLWAEDGPLYLQQAEQFGIRSLLIPDGGYLHFVPRFIALFWSFLRVNYLYIPACYSFTQFFFVFFIALNIWKTTAYLNIKNRVLYATCFLLLPLGSDVFMNLTNINWIASLYLVNFLFVRYTDYTGRHWYLNLVILFIISLSGPFSTLLSPLVILSIVMERKELSVKRLIPLGIILLGGAIQFFYIKFIDPGFYRGQPGPPEHYHLLKLITNNMGELLFFKYGFMNSLKSHFLECISLIVFLILLGIFIVRYKRIDNKRKYLLLCYAIIVISSFIQAYWPNESKIPLDNPRYYFLPFTCIGWLMILSFKKRINLMLIAFYLFFLWHLPYLKLILQNKEWEKQISEYYQGKRQIIYIGPDGWKITLPEKR